MPDSNPGSDLKVEYWNLEQIRIQISRCSNPAFWRGYGRKIHTFCTRTCILSRSSGMCWTRIQDQITSWMLGLRDSLNSNSYRAALGNTNLHFTIIRANSIAAQDGMEGQLDRAGPESGLRTESWTSGPRENSNSNRQKVPAFGHLLLLATWPNRTNNSRTFRFRSCSHQQYMVCMGRDQRFAAISGLFKP